jgi:hypothetical protein
MNREENGVVKQVSLFGFAAALLVFIAVGTQAVTPGMPELNREQNAANVLLAQAAATAPTPVLTPTTPAYNYRGQTGKQFTYSCPAGNSATGSIWGTDVYTDDSSVCSAGVHAGVITQAAGGSVTIEIRPGQSTYTSTTRNGVYSYAYGSWTGSFAVVNASASAPTPAPASLPTCAITTDKTSYSYGDSMLVTWSSQNATYATWVPDTSGKDNIQVSTDKLPANGSQTFTASVTGNPYLTMSVNGSGGTATCSKVIPVTDTRNASQICSPGTTGTYPNCVPVLPPTQTCPSGTTGTYPNCTTFTPVTRTTTCAPNFSLGAVWGTGIYTDDSNVCTAALHAGLIKRAEGGVVTTESRPGQSSYTGSTNNGVTSYSYGSWSGSYIVKPGTTPVSTTPAQSTVCTYTSNTNNTPRTATVSQSNTIDSCRATCTIIKNEVYGLGDAGVCKFTDASGAMTTTNIPAAVTPAPTTRVQVIVPVANVRSNSSATAVIAGTQSYGAAGSVSNPSTTVDGYTWYLVDFDSGADGWTIASNIQFPSTPVATPMVSVDGGATLSFTTATPTLSGSATNATVLNATIEPVGGTPTSSVSNIVVTASGRWSFAIPTLANGQYVVRIYSGSVLLYNISVTITIPAVAQTCAPGQVGTYPNCTPYSATTQVCPSGTTGAYPNCAVIETGTGQFSTQVIVPVANVRANASASATVLGTQASGAMGAIVGGPVTADGYTWYQVDFNAGADGWTVSSNIQVPQNVSTTPVTTTTTTNNTTNTTPAPTTTVAPALYAIGARVATVVGANVRAIASLAGGVVGVQATGALGAVTGGPVNADGYTWWQINFDVGGDGWTIQDNLTASTLTSSPTCPAGNTGTYPNCSPIASQTPTLSTVRVLNYSQGTASELANVAPGTNANYYCMPDGRPATNGTIVYLSRYQPYWPVYGGTNGIYSIDSDICASAVQAGVITSAAGGNFILQATGMQAVTGINANGIISSAKAAGPTYKFATPALNAPSTAMLSVSATSGLSPLTVTFTVNNVAPTELNAYTINSTGPSGENYGSYLFQGTDAYATSGTRAITYTVPGVNTVKLMHNKNGTFETLDTKTITVERPATAISATPAAGPAPLSVNFVLSNLEVGSMYSLDFGAGSGPVSLGYVVGTSMGTAAGYSRPGTYTVKVLKAGAVVATTLVTVQ